MAKKTPVHLTREQLIAEAFKNCREFAENALPDAIPEHLNFKIGDSVEVGQLQNLVISDIQAPLVLLENTNPLKDAKSNNSKEFMVYHWSEMVLHKNIRNESFSTNATYRITYSNAQLDSLLASVTRRGINESTDFQRGYVWTLSDKQRLIQSIFEGKEIGKFLLLEDKTYKEYRLEILDGKQRINALLGFLGNEFSYEGVFYHQLSKRDRNTIDSQGVQSASLDINHFSRRELLEIFLNVNDSGVPQTEEHLQHVRELLQEEIDNSESMRN